MDPAAENGPLVPEAAAPEGEERSGAGRTMVAGGEGTAVSRPVVALLSADVAGKIAAGECVERPASVVKELVENALDAGASRITVEMEDGGREVIRVSDNGCGMSRDDLVLAVQRHATSKIAGLDDLSSIRTLGFRGEALPSVAAVSRMEITASTPAGEAHRLTLQAGEIEDLEECGAPHGTTVVVRDLFYNTPARLKFLRSAQTEFGHALEHLTRLAISHHGVAFRVIHNGREALNTPGSPEALNAIVAAYGPDTAREMTRVDSLVAPFHVRGYVSRPALTRANRSQQSFFVNRRWVRSRTLSHALDQGFRTLLTVGRHAVAAILIDVPPGLVDVNVHPTKAEVRFLRDWEVHQAVTRAVRDALVAVNLVPEVRPVVQSAAPAPAPSLWEQSAPVATGPGNLLSGNSPDRDPGASWAGDAGQSPGGAALPFYGAAGVEDPPAARDRDARAPMLAQAPRPSAVYGPLAGARIVGQLHRCYLVAETQEGIVLIDQHAAHERILYEKLLRPSGGPQAQQLVVPITLTLGHREAALAQDRLEEFRKLGFAIEPFGPSSFLVRTVPLLARRTNFEELLRDLVDELAGADFGRKMRLQRERIAASMACRAAIKQGDLLSPPEMDALLDELRSVDRPLELPTNCPHGRPTSILLTLGQVERMFQRT